MTVVSAGLANGQLEDIAEVIRSDPTEHCRIVAIDFGPLLEARPQIPNAVATATGLEPPPPLGGQAPHMRAVAGGQAMPRGAV